MNLKLDASYSEGSIISADFLAQFMWEIQIEASDPKALASRL